MNCLKFEKLIYDYLEDRLSREIKNDMTDHFFSCDVCCNKYYDDMMLKLGLDCLGDKTLPYNFHEEMADIIYSYKNKSKKKTAVLSLVACACAAVIIISAVSLSGIYKNNNVFSQGEGVVFSAEAAAEPTEMPREEPAELPREEAAAAIFVQSSYEETADESVIENEAPQEAAPGLGIPEESSVPIENDKNMPKMKSAKVRSKEAAVLKEISVNDRDVFDKLKTSFTESGIIINENDNIISFVCDDEKLVNDILKTYAVDASVLPGEVVNIVLL